MIDDFFPSDKFYSGTKSTSLPPRDEIEKKYKWELTHIFQSEELWEKDFNWVEQRIDKYKEFEGTLSSSAYNLLECLKFDNETNIKLEKLHLYAMLAKDSDLRVPKYQALNDRINGLVTKVNAADSFIRPELLSIPAEKLQKMIDSLDELKIYQHFFEDLLRAETHTLSKEQEEILALTGEINMIPYDAYSMFTNADIKFSKVKDENGNEIETSHARFYAGMYSKDREYRQRIFKSYLSSYKNYINTFTALFNGNLKTNIFVAKARRYNSAREAALDRNNIPVSVYNNLIDTVNKNLEPLHRWASLKKKLLKVDELHPYDVYVSLFHSKSERKYPYEEAKEIVKEALKILGENYLFSLQEAFDNRWIDVYETQAKRNGAYSSGPTYGVHPYVLLNWADLINDVFTLAHEMGHNMHSYYTGKLQPYLYADYTIFLAEVASTFNESLLLELMIKKSDSKNDKLFLLEKYLNNITSTFYRQTMFAEYEMTVYDKTEKGIALTPDILSEIYKNIYQRYWGTEMVINIEEKYTWARIPHFYYNFYVYQYATGFAASEVLTQKVKNEGKPAVEKYINFLKAGSSDYSLNILKSAGVDMTSPVPVLATTQKMNDLLNEVDRLIGS